MHTAINACTWMLGSERNKITAPVNANPQALMRPLINL